MDRATILGAGIMGLTLARELAKRGVEVTLLDPGEVAVRSDGRATGAAMGVLSPPEPSRSPWGRLQAAAWRFYPSFALQLAEEVGGPPLLQGRELASLRRRTPAFSDAAWAGLRESALGSLRRRGLPGRWIEGEALARELPFLEPGRWAALVRPDAAVIDALELSRALWTSCQALGVRSLRGEGTVRLRCDGTPAAMTAGGALLEGPVVVAAGAWSPGLVPEEIASGIPVAPAKGQVIEVRGLESHGLRPTSPILRFEAASLARKAHVLARPGGTAWIGSTLEEAGFSTEVTEAGLEALIEAGRELFAFLERSHVVEAWAGLRPRALRRGGPFLGEVPGTRGLWAATGHYRSGIRTAPISAAILARRMLGDEEGLETDLGLTRAIVDEFRVGRPE